MHDKAFIDTNIFLYAFCDKDIHKQGIAKEIVLQNYSISVQVINETSNNLIKKLNFNEDNIKSFLQSAYTKYEIIGFTENIFIKASNVRMQLKYSYYDSLIIAAALERQCTFLYSEDLQHNHLIENQLKIINPFQSLNP